MCIGVGKEPEVGALAAEGECLLSVNGLLARHLSPEPSARRRQKQFTYFATIWYRSCLSESWQCILIRLWASSEKGLVLRTPPGGVCRLLILFSSLRPENYPPSLEASCCLIWQLLNWLSYPKPCFCFSFCLRFPCSRYKVWRHGTVTTENTRSRLERGA